MAVDARQQDGMAGRGGVEIARGGELAAPVGLIPIAADDPLACRLLLGRLEAGAARRDAFHAHHGDLR